MSYSFDIIKNQYNNYIDINSGLLFDPTTNEAYGRQYFQAILPLSLIDIELCLINNIRFRTTFSTTDELANFIYTYPNQVYNVLATCNPMLITQQLVSNLVNDGILDIYEEAKIFGMLGFHNFADFIERKDLGFLNFLINDDKCNQLFRIIEKDPKNVHYYLVWSDWEAFTIELIKALVKFRILDVDEVSSEYDGRDAINISFRQHLKLLCDEYVTKDKKLYKQLDEINRFVLKI